MHYHVGAQLQRTLEVRAGEGVVDDHERTGRVGRVDHGGDVDDAQQRVGGRLQPDQARRGAQGAGHGGRVRRVDVVDLHPKARQQTVKEAGGAAIQVVVRHDMVAALQQVGDGRFGAHARAEGQPVVAALQRRHALLQRGPRGVAGARVFVALVLPHALLGEGRGLVDWHRDGAGCRLRLLAHVDGAGGEAPG